VGRNQQKEEKESREEERENREKKKRNTIKLSSTYLDSKGMGHVTSFILLLGF
jgi:hypothetical protein